MFAYVDIDGVLLDLIGSVKEILDSKGIDFFPEKIESYNFNGDIGCKKSEIYKCLNDVETFKSAKFYSGALDALEKLSSKYTVKPFTKSSSKSELINERMSLLNLLELEQIVFVGNKLTPLSNENDVMFEDCYENIVKCINDGFRGRIYLINHPWNKNCDISGYSNVIRSDSFSDAVNHLLGL